MLMNVGDSDDEWAWSSGIRAGLVARESGSASCSIQWS